MNRIYHRYENWECYKNGFFDSPNGRKEELKEKVIELFSNPKLTEEYMNKVVNEWTYSCEHNLTNISLNRIAWLGQSACCLYAKIPYRVTMETWRYVPPKFQEIANSIADNIIKQYEESLNNKQLCLNFI